MEKAPISDLGIGILSRKSIFSLSLALACGLAFLEEVLIIRATLTKVDYSGRTLYGHNGGVWEWTTTPLAGYPGYVPSELYPGYSADFFDDKHFVVVCLLPLPFSAPLFVALLQHRFDETIEESEEEKSGRMRTKLIIRSEDPMLPSHPLLAGKHSGTGTRQITHTLSSGVGLSSIFELDPRRCEYRGSLSIIQCLEVGV